MLIYLGGALSSLVGLGGGVIFNPLMLHFRVHPKVASSTSMYLVMLSTFAATMQFYSMGLIQTDYAIALGIISIIFILIGNSTVNSYVNKMGKPSVLVLFLAWVVVLCTVIVIGAGLAQVYIQVKEGGNVLAFNSY
jgi:uncharacterized membrane protein YfcA